jgi:NADPH2:quinone reductase
MLDFQWEVRALTQDSGVDVIIDTIGSAAFQAAAQCLAPRGRLLFLGEIAGGEVSFSPTLLMFLDAQLLGSTGSGRADLDLALRLAASGAITPVATEFPLPEAPAVHRLIRERQVFGRAVLVP